MKDKHTFRIPTLAALVLGILLAVARILISRTSLESGIELYAHDTPAATALHIAIAVCAVGLCALAVVLRISKHTAPSDEEKAHAKEDAAKRKAEKTARKEALAALSPDEALAYRHEDKRRAAKEEYRRREARYQRECARMERAFSTPSKCVTFAGIFLGIMILLYDVTLVIDMANNHWSAIAPLIGRAPLGSNTASAVLTLVHLLSALPAALYFFKSATAMGKPSPAYGVLASTPAIWCLLTTLTLYFRMDVAYNSPTKLLRLISLVVFLLWQVQEGRALLGIPKRGLLAGFGAAATVLTLTCGISDLALYAMGVISLPCGYIEAVLYIALGAYTAARNLQYR